MWGAIREYMISHTNTNITNNNSRVVPPDRPSLEGEFSIIPHEPNEDPTPLSSKWSKGTLFGSKNKSKLSIFQREETGTIDLIEIPTRNDIVENSLSWLYVVMETIHCWADDKRYDAGASSLMLIMLLLNPTTSRWCCGANSTPLTRQPPPPTNVNAIQWNDYTLLIIISDRILLVHLFFFLFS